MSDCLWLYKNLRVSLPASLLVITASVHTCILVISGASEGCFFCFLAFIFIFYSLMGLKQDRSFIITALEVIFSHFFRISRIYQKFRAFSCNRRYWKFLSIWARSSTVTQFLLEVITRRQLILLLCGLHKYLETVSRLETKSTSLSSHHEKRDYF